MILQRHLSGRYELDECIRIGRKGDGSSLVIASALKKNPRFELLIRNGALPDMRYLRPLWGAAQLAGITDLLNLPGHEDHESVLKWTAKNNSKLQDISKRPVVPRTSFFRVLEGVFFFHFSTATTLVPVRTAESFHRALPAQPIIRNDLSERLSEPSDAP